MTPNQKAGAKHSKTGEKPFCPSQQPNKLSNQKDTSKEKKHNWKNQNMFTTVGYCEKSDLPDSATGAPD